MLVGEDIMLSFLPQAVILLLLIVLLGFFNEKVTKFPYEISLMLYSVVVGIGVLILASVIRDASVSEIFENLQVFNLEGFLMEGVLCFMLFAGSCHMRLLDFKKHARPITLLSIGATLLGAIFYGVLFYAGASLMGLPFTFPVCLMFGSITAPTDPIAATSILKKFNLPKEISFIMEGESLFNDGVGVALFVCFSGMVTMQENGSFLAVMGKELFGAVLVGIVVTALCFPIFAATGEGNRRIFVSLLAVSMAYVLCEHFGFSGAIASVVCGILFSALRNHREQKGKPMELQEFDTFWEILDSLLNSILYVMMGLTFVHILQMPQVLLISCLAVIFNLIGRFSSVGLSTLFAGKLPNGYDKLNFTKLLTYGGMRGGLSIALAMSTRGMVSIETYNIILGSTYAIVFFTTVVQGLTMKRVYQKIAENISCKAGIGKVSK
jgi:CPA1 family monovalent cation:H+ antiporter